MTDRINALVVVLKEDFREDDIQSLVEAICHFRGIHSVTKNVASMSDHIATERAKMVYRSRLLQIVE